MKSIIGTAACLTALAVSAPAAEWDIESVAPGAMPEIAIDSKGFTHLSWAIEDQEDALYYGRRESDGWDITLLPASDSFAIPFDLAVDRDDHAHIAFHEHNTGNAAHLVDAGSGWQMTLIISEGHDGWVPSIALAPDGAPHIVSFNSAEGIQHATWNGTQWEVESVGTGPLVDTFGVAVAVDESNRPYVCYHDGDFTSPPGGNGSLYCASRGTNGWETDTVDAAGDVGKFVSLGLDSQGNPHVAYLKWETLTSATIRYARRAGNSWAIEDVAILKALGTDLSGAHRTVSLAVDGQDRPHIAASDRSSVVYAVRTESGWAVETVIEQAASNLVFGQLASIALDPEGQPHIAFSEVPDQTNSSLGTVYYATVARRTKPALRRPTRRIKPSIAR